MSGRVDGSVALVELGEFEVRSIREEDREGVMELWEGMPEVDDCECRIDVEEAMKRYMSRPEDHMWVAEAGGKIVGSVAAYVCEEGIGHLCRLHVVSDSEDHAVRKGLVREAVAHTLRQGILKLIVHAHVNSEHAIAFLRKLGFRFSRHREVEKRPAMEFYLDFYAQPEG